LWRRLVAAGALILCATASGATAPAATWTTWGGNPERWGAVTSDPTALARNFVLPLTGRITSQILFADGSFFAATSAGNVVSFTSSGTIRWEVDVGQLTNRCAQLDGYGVTGTGVIDPATSTLYVADAFGRLHALSLANGSERPGWPVRLFTDNRRELAWGALTFADGAVYIPTASYCDTPGTPGAVYRVDTSTRAVSQWLSVPLASGGGGGPWGWGGLAYDPTVDQLFAVTSGAFDGGTNSGSTFTEFTGYGDQLVEFAPNLSVQASNHPGDIPDRLDLDFVGSPVVFTRQGCGPLVAAVDKNDTVYLWRAGAVGAGPVAELSLQQYDAADPMLAQLAWAPAESSLYTATGTQLVRIAVGADCSARLEWSDPLGTYTENGSPTVAGNLVWLAVNGKPMLEAFDATTGKRVFQAPLGGTTVTAPTVVDGRLVVGTFTGLVESFAFDPTRTLSSASAVTTDATHVSWATAKDAWETRGTGVFATENGGHSWHQIYVGPALSILRISADAGVIELGTAPGPCSARPGSSGRTTTERSGARRTRSARASLARAAASTGGRAAPCT
jgi:hypothetical protein